MKSLVVYFSRRGENYAVGNIKEGNAEHIAKEIQTLVDGDIFEIEPVRAYANDYKKCTEEALEELQKNAKPEIKNGFISIEPYDVIYLCYPNWWGTFPRPVATFLSQHDFKGKTIMPMCTHEGSEMGSSESELKSVLKGAKIKKGLAIRGIEARSSTHKIRTWITKEIGSLE